MDWIGSCFFLQLSHWKVLRQNFGCNPGLYWFKWMLITHCSMHDINLYSCVNAVKLYKLIGDTWSKRIHQCSTIHTHSSSTVTGVSMCLLLRKLWKLLETCLLYQLAIITTSLFKVDYHYMIWSFQLEPDGKL